MKKISPWRLTVWGLYLFTVVFVWQTAPNGVAFAVTAGLALAILAVIGPPIPLVFEFEDRDKEDA